MILKRQETRSLLWCLIDLAIRIELLDEEETCSSGRFAYMSYPNILYLEYYLMSKKAHKLMLKTYDNIDIGGAR
jgi:hypothetical protein